MSAVACAGDARRAKVRDDDALPNGIDHVEVVDVEDGAPRQRTLLLRMLRDFAPGFLGASNVRIEGGVRVRGIRVEWALRADAAQASHPEEPWLAGVKHPLRTLVVRASAVGDFSTYRLRLVGGASSDAPPAGVDPPLADVEFSFKVDCPSPFDCRADDACPPEGGVSPPIDYLAKDYASFRRLMLDRLAVTLPAWKERNAADGLMTLVEAVAYAADGLSYMQDAVATEAYLGTARRRTSIRRHARLLDYAMHDGCNARTVVCFEATGDGDVPAGTRVLSGTTGLADRIPLADAEPACAAAAVAFETMEPARARLAHNTIPLHDWGEPECCLPEGATQATLRGDFPDLAAGAILVFEEVLSPTTGRPEDADVARRHAVRLTGVEPDEDEVEKAKTTIVRWAAQDALPFPLWVTVLVDGPQGPLPVHGVTVARGNAALADHGLTLDAATVRPDDRPRVNALDPPLVPERGDYRPELPRRNVTHAARRSKADEPVAASLRQDPRAALPVARLEADGETWTAARDLLASGPDRPDFVVETEDDGTARLRFGDGRHGRRPAPLTAFAPTYRVGNGAEGNVGPDALRHVVTGAPVARARNPLPAMGGTQPESVEVVRRDAPQAFRVQERCVTEDDYASAADEVVGVQKARATLRWTGSWYTVFVAADCEGGGGPDPEAQQRLLDALERRRLAGVDLEVDPPIFVPLDVALTVCVTPDRPKEDVERDLLDALSSRDLPDGRRGLFHPDRLTFGQPVFLSAIVAAAMQVPGVKHVDASVAGGNRFQRWGKTPQGELESGVLALGRLEIARLDNDPSLPENGRIELRMEGGL